MIDFIKSRDKKYWHTWCLPTKHWLMVGIALIAFGLGGGQFIVKADSAASQPVTTQQVNTPEKNIIATGMNGTAKWELDDQGTLDVTTNGKSTAQLGEISNENLWNSWGDLNKDIVKKINIEKGVTFPEHSGGMFSDFTNVTSINGLENINKKNVDAFDYMFSGCSSLTHLDVSNWDVSNGEDFFYMFYGCSSLTHLDVSNWDVSNGRDFEGMFSNCSSLTNLDLSKWNVNNAGFLSRMFYGCSSLTSLDLSHWNLSNVIETDSMLSDMTNLWKLKLGPNTFLVQLVQGDSVFTNVPAYGTPIPGFTTHKVGPSSDATAPRWQAVDTSKDGSEFNPKGDLYDASLLASLYAKGNANHPTKAETYVWQNVPVKQVTQTPPTPTEPSTPSAPPTTSESPVPGGNPGANDNDSGHHILPKGEVVYALKRINLYQNADLNKSERVASYIKEPRIYRPMFVVTGYARSQNNVLRYKVRDVNHDSKTAGKTGYITANWNYVRPVYYQAKHKKLTVINPRGVNAYKNKNLTNKVKNYKQGTVLPVVNFVTHNLTTRYVLKNGQYITGNRKLVDMNKHNQVRYVKAKRTLNLYRTVNLTGKKKQIKKGTVLQVKNYDYSYGNDFSKSGVLRYRVAGGYITANAKYVNLGY
ncbi:BspA family leucine-rich repeat surface protein [Lentilactobacillus sp. Marseille-Q4993]|uniref:BspA family leucine-rich repeat surface protein n=1 Tax=Lentilactobacillus sp. Marseille-Q4993 TaxID=3039492 RepID=UPI0024BCF6D0|nr:BspA family leucine-rich repeat surface protein [Lentilactobacillus sp. Marseille-Q4993]